MEQLKVIANKLNIRTSPVLNFTDKHNIIGVLHKDSVFESVSEITNELGIWHVDRDGNWASEKWLDNLSKADISIPEWMTTLKIPQLWEYATGKNVGVAVIDTGIDFENAELPYDKSKTFVFSNVVSLQDTQGHGTHCSGLIGARNRNKKIIGTAPSCNLFICKIAGGSNLEESETIRYADAINWCADQEEIHVISISWGSFINRKDILEKIQQAIDNAVNKKKIVVCAIGDATQFNDPGPLYPAALLNTISIGSVPIKNILYPYINSSLLTIVDGLNIPSYSINGEILQLTGTSQSNAIVAGIVALIIEKKNFSYDIGDIRRILLGASALRPFENLQLPVLNGDLLLTYFKNPSI
ncbi:S8 family peptidase [Flavitalea sp.]|nr:S8/S53 family peptidase [Flavitalea sp.]